MASAPTWTPWDSGLAEALFDFPLEQYVDRVSATVPVNIPTLATHDEAGRPTRIDHETVQCWADAFRHQRPKDPLRVTLWPKDDAGVSSRCPGPCLAPLPLLLPGHELMLVDGVHPLLGLWDMRADALATGVELTQPMQTVEATILRHDCPEFVRLALAGDEWYRLLQAPLVPYSEFLRRLVQWRPRPGRSTLCHQIAESVRMCGYRRDQTKVCFRIVSATAGDPPLFSLRPT